MDKNTNKHQRYSVDQWSSDETKVWWARVYVAGNYQSAEMVCRECCFPKGLCVTLEPTKYIFAGGTEDGVCVGLIQYVPFPEKKEILVEKAVFIGKRIAEINCQWSFSIITPTDSIFYSRRKK